MERIDPIMVAAEIGAVKFMEVRETTNSVIIDQVAFDKLLNMVPHSVHPTSVWYGGWVWTKQEVNY